MEQKELTIKEQQRIEHLTQIKKHVAGLTIEQKDKLKSDAITTLFNSGIIQHKITGVCHKYRIPAHSKINEDILQVTFEQLSKYNTDKFCEANIDNPTRIIGLAVCTMIRKGVASDPKNPSYPKLSIARWILYGSNINQNEGMVDDENTTHGWDTITEKYVDDVDDTEERMFKYIRNNIDVDDTARLNNYLNPDAPKIKYSGKNGIRLKEENQLFLNRLKIIINEFKRREND